ncbi:MAG: Methyltransferase protein [Ignavibacteria bacterium]|nr:Methyltransferase protein [Ignavibacteria bacterium]
MNSDEIKQLVKEKYGYIALNSIKPESSCGCGCSDKDYPGLNYKIIDDEYHTLEGYIPDADLNLGCGLPTEFANIRIGDTVLDLGSGAGNDVFVARQIVGETGKVIGVDMTDEMLAKANANNSKIGFRNVEFRKGEIESLPVEDNSFDVVISNCVLNLVPDKSKAFSEVYRVLKFGGHFCISDIVLNGELPEGLREAAEMYVGCISGALEKDDYLNKIKGSGFRKIEIRKEEKLGFPDELLLRFINSDELETFKKSGSAAYSITVYGEK